MKLILRLIATLCFIISIVWLIANPGFEPLLAFLTGVATLLTSFSIDKRNTSSESFYQRNQGSIPSEYLPPDESITQYLLNLEAYLDQYSVARSSFVELSAQVKVHREVQEIELLQSFVWMKRDWKDPVRKEEKKSIDLLKAHEAFRNYVLLGEPGSGKTTCLQYLIFELIARYRDKTSDLLPVFVSLSDWQDRRMPATEFLRTRLAEVAGSTNYLVKDLENLLSQGKLIIILDGLNEMPNRFYREEEEIGDRIEFLVKLSKGDLFLSKQDPRERSLMELSSASAVRARFIISCRSHEFFRSPNWQEIYILPMNEDQIHSFINNHLVDEFAKELEEILQSNQELHALAANPFFLQSMINAYSPDLAGMRNRGQFLEYLLEKSLAREHQRGKIFDQPKVKKCLCNIAFSMLKKDRIGSQINVGRINKKNQAALDAFLGTGLLVARNEQQTFFYHQLIQEFMAAVAMRERWVHFNISTLLCNKKWSEVIILWHDIDKKSKILPKLLQSLKQRNRPWTKPFSRPISVTLEYGILSFVYTFVGTNIIIDLLTNHSFIIAKLKLFPIQSVLLLIALPLLIRYILLFSSYNVEAISNSAYVLGKVGNPIAIDNIIFAFKRVGFSRAKLAQALFLYGKKAIQNLVAGLSSNDYSIKKGCIEALSLLGDEQVVEPLLDVLKQNDTNLTWTLTSSLRKIKDPRVGLAIAKTLYLNDGGCSRLLSTVQTSNSFENYEPFDLQLLNLLEGVAEESQPSINRSMGIQAIGSYGYYEGLGKLEEIIDDKEELQNFKLDAIKALASIRSPEAIRKLVSLYEESEYDSPIQNAAWNALASIKHTNIGSELYQALYHEDKYVRLAAVKSLGLIHDRDSISYLKGMATTENEYVIRAEIARVLREIGGNDAINLLQVLCRDSESDVRKVALQCLDLYFPDHAKKIFLELAIDSTYADRVKVVELLSLYRFPDVRSALLDLCADTDGKVKVQATESLQRIDLNLTDELKFVALPKRRRLIYWPFLLLENKMNWDEYERLISELRFRGAEERWLFFTALGHIQRDADLKRKFRYLNILYGIFGVALGVITPSVLVAIFVRGVLFIGKLISGNIYWYYLSIGFIGLTAISYLPFIRKVTKEHKFVQFLISVIRLWGIPAAFILLSYAIIIHWIISLIIFFTFILISWKSQNQLSRWLNDLISWQQRRMKHNAK